MSEIKPTPLLMARKTHAIAVEPVTDLTPGKVVRPTGKRTALVTTVDDGVRKAKQVQPGMRVRPYLHGKAVGGERVIESVERVEGDTLVRITYSSAHVTQDYKPAYRFVCLDLVGRETITRQVLDSIFVEVR